MRCGVDDIGVIIIVMGIIGAGKRMRRMRLVRGRVIGVGAGPDCPLLIRVVAVGGCC